MGRPKQSLHRKVRVDYRAGDQIGYKTKSFTNKIDEWHPTIDVHDGTCHCDCPQYRFRKIVCKHIVRSAQNAIRSKLAEPTLLKRLGVSHCSRCLGTEDLMLMCSDDGMPLPDDILICRGCIVDIQAEAFASRRRVK